MTVEIHYADEGVAIGSCGCVVLFVWRGEVTLERLQAGEEALRARAAACPEAIAILNVAEDGAPPPSGEPLRRMRVTLDAIEPLTALGVVLEGEPRWLALALDTMTALGLRMRRRVVQKHSVSREEACTWLHRRCQDAGAAAMPSREALLAAIDAVQSALIAAPALSRCRG